MLAVDAFSSDSIPIHLLTEEAMALYQRHMGIMPALTKRITGTS